METARDWTILLQAVFVALVAALGSWAAARASGRASVKVSDNDGRIQMEKEAYDRARAYDTETIKRQDAEIDELRGENKELRQDNERMRQKISQLEARMAHMERAFAEAQREGFNDSHSE